jgi:type I restriction enzyme S subunit
MTSQTQKNQVFPPSVKPGIPKLGPRPAGWRRVRFGDILEVISRPVRLDPDTSYQLVNAKRNRGGIVSRGKLPGREILTKTQFRIHAGDFLISRRQIIHGACGIVPTELDGALVSNEYSVLRPKDGLLLDYLAYYTHTVHFQQTCFHSSVGVAIEKMVFKLEAWLRHEVHLPPIPEQEQIVGVLSTLDRAIATTTKLIEAKRELKRGLAQQLLTGKRRLPGFAGKWRSTTLGAVAKVNPPTPAPEQDTQEVSFFTMADVPAGGGRVTGSIRPYREVKSGFTSFRRNDTLVAKITPCFENGKGALVDELKNGYGFGSTEFHVVRPLEGSHPEFIYHLTMTKDFRSHGIANMVGSAGQKRVPALFLRKYPVALPNLREQEAISRVIGLVDRAVERGERRLAALQNLRSGLLHKVFKSG